MPMYTFYLCDAGGRAGTFEAFELTGDAGVNERAHRVLKDHPRCAYVNVWAGERKVMAVHRDTGSREAAASRRGSGSD